MRKTEVESQNIFWEVYNQMQQPKKGIVWPSIEIAPHMQLATTSEKRKLIKSKSVITYSIVMLDNIS